MRALLVAVHLLSLHRSDGGEVIVNGDQVTTLRSTAGVERLAPGHCIVGLVDGKFVAVLEPCEEVKRQLELISPHPNPK